MSSTISYPPELPITERRDELLAVIREHQVVVVAGETGSGKSTQLPKLCLELGRGETGWIGHTQPRRIAARTIAERVAEELGTKVGGTVGYAVRFTDEVGDDTRIKLMTDGILLAEIQRDRQLGRYDTIIIDEAHERSLNIDFLLGYLHRLLPRRPDLKLVITSATIDTERFASHFGDAPIVEVSGRTYPVEMRYRPLDGPEGDSLDQAEGICHAVRELQREGPGDVLVFCSGEREIRDAAQALRGLRLPDTEILPLYARLTAAEQHRVFQAHTGRRIVLATNVAETSLTVPGVRFVVDPGTARISRYSHRTKVQRLPIEAVSKASANQRAGRCGRLGPGICIRLFDEADFEARPDFTEPEIQRTNLASVVLQMAALGLGDVEQFPFVDPPDTRAVRDGINLLVELGAVDPAREGARGWLTPLGRQLAQLPIDPRLGRMVLAGIDRGCLHEVMVIAAGLSIQDPRERPTGPDQASAAGMHARFDADGSDLLGYLELWGHIEALRHEQRSGNQFRKQLKAEFLHVLRIREWQDLYAQLRRVARRMGARPNREPAPPEQVHRALLTGLLSHVGTHTGVGRDYRGARNSRFTLARDALGGTGTPRWVMAAELVETTRVWARGAARVQPEWIEEAADHLVARSYGEPRWDPDRGTATTTERVTLHGLPLVADRTVELSRVDPVAARRLFVDHALVDGEWDRRHDFIDRNADRIAEVEALGARVRRDVLAPPERIAAFFDGRVPDHVVSGRHFDRWWSRRRRRDPELLDIPLDVLVDPGAGRIDLADFPDTWEQAGIVMPLTYVFDPSDPLDGVSVDIPVSGLARLDAGPFEWNVPGRRAELVDALLRGLPKPLRRRLVPIPDTVEALLDGLDPCGGSLLDALREELTRLTGERVRRGDLELDRLPPHLRMTFRVHDDSGRIVATGKDLDALRAHLATHVRDALSDLGIGIERSGLTAWPGGELARTIVLDAGGHEVTAYPALVDEGETVAVRLLPDRAEQRASMWEGTRRLLQLQVPAAARALGRLPSERVRAAIATSPYHDEREWLDDLLAAVFDRLIDDAGGPAWDDTGFEALRATVRDGLGDALRDAWSSAVDVLDHHHRIGIELGRLDGPGFAAAVGDIRRQLDRLVFRGMLAAVGLERLPDIARYLRAIERRLERLPDDPAKDRERMLRCQRLEADYDQLRERVPWSLELEEVGWLLEEYRVATFAQQLGTARPVSEKRIWAAIGRLDRS